jgi:gluconolactonase
MRTLIGSTAIALMLSCANAVAQPTPAAMESFDPAFGALAGNAMVEVLREDVRAFFEGPVWHRGGFLTFSNLVANRIDRFDPASGEFSVYIDEIWKGRDSASAIHFERDGESFAQVGANGETLDAEGRLVFTAMGSGKIMRRENDGTITILAQGYNGHHLNAPNDLVYRADGALYFTDIRAGLVTADENPPDGVPHTGVYRLKNGTLTLLDDMLVAPNGIALSPDGAVLYVNDIRARIVYAYDVNAAGTVSNKRVFFEVPANPDRPGNPDGMKLDVHGNIWNSGPGGIWVISPEGKHLGTVLLPERISNLAWGGDDAMTIYATGPTKVMRVRVTAEGLRP